MVNTVVAAAVAAAVATVTATLLVLTDGKALIVPPAHWEYIIGALVAGIAAFAAFKTMAVEHDLRNHVHVKEIPSVPTTEVIKEVTNEQVA